MLSHFNHPKEIQKLLVDLLYKKGYCLCVPDSQLIQSYFQKVPKTWVQNFLLSKNQFGLSVIPMFMLIFLKNKSLTVAQSQGLLELLKVLINQADNETMVTVCFTDKIEQLAWGYYSLNALIEFSQDFVITKKNEHRIMAMATIAEFFFKKFNNITMTKFCLNTENNGFNILHKLFYVIAYKNLHSSQIIYLSAISEKIIAKTSHLGIETVCFQIQRNGYSFIWCAIGTWLQIVFERENSNPFKIKHYTHLINAIVEKINDEKLSTLLFEKETKGYIIILRFIFFNRFIFNLLHRDLIPSLHFFKQWLNKILATLTFHQIELIVETLPLVLNNDLTLSNSDKRQLQQQFFDYLFDFCKLQAQDIARLKDLQERFEVRFFPSNKIMKFFKQIKSHCCFFNRTNFQGSINNGDDISLDETSDLLRPEYARLPTNYLTVNR